MLNTVIPLVRRSYEKAISFFLGSAAGLTIDLIVFQSLIYLGIEPFYSNMTSSGLAITATYFFATRYTFQKKPNITKFAFFFAYYASSIALFSIAIDLGAGFSNWPPMLCKILSLPFSFAVNFLFSNIILGKK